jgi:hypothetical protein
VNHVVKFGRSSDPARSSNTGVSHWRSGTRSRASITLAGRSSSAAACYRLRRPGVFGDDTLTVRIARHRREGLDQLHIIGDAIGGILVGPDIDADDAAEMRARPAAAAPRPRRHC